MAISKRRFATRLFLVVLLTYDALAITWIVLIRQRRSYFSEMERRYPFEAHSHGQVLTGDYGHPLRFSTKELASRYEQDYDRNSDTISAARR